MTQSDHEEKKLSIMVQEGMGWKRTLEIEVPRESVDSEFEAVYKKYQSLSRIPGFRKGKAPMHLVKLRYKEAIDEEVLESLVPKAYEDAVKEKDLSPICLPVVKDIQFEEGTSLKFKAEIEVKPEIKTLHYMGLPVKKMIRSITDKDVEKSLDFLREDFAELHPVQRTAKFYDYLIVDVTRFQEDKQDKAENQQIFLDPHNMIKEFQEALIDAKAGDEKQFEVEYSTTFHNKTLAGKKVKYHISIKEVKENILPDADDNFAKTAGGFNSLDELKSKIRKNLTIKAQNDAEIEVRNELITQVIRHNLFEIPETLFNFYMDSLIEDLKKQYRKVDETKVREEYKNVAIGHLRWDFLFHQIAEKEKVEVTKEDLETWCEHYARGRRKNVEEVKKTLENPSQLKRLKEDLLEQKVLDFLLKNAKVKEETFQAEETKEENLHPGGQSLDKT